MLFASEPSPGLIICELWDHAHGAGRDRRGWLAAYWSLIDWDYIGERFVGVHEGKTHL